MGNKLKAELLRDFGSNFNKEAEETFNSVFLNNKTSWVNDVVNSYTRFNVTPNESILKLASQYNLNEEQVKRLIEETNVNIYLQKYAMTKSNKVRRVEFPLANPSEILQSVNKVASPKEGEIGKSTGSMEKAASYTPGLEKMAFVVEEKDNSNFLTSQSSNYMPPLWDKGKPEKVASKFVKEAIEKRIESMSKAKVRDMKRILQKIACIGDALIYNERAGQNAQAMLDKIAVDAQCFNKDQVPYIKYVREKVEIMKEARKLPLNFNMNLQLTKKAATVNNPYSLGKHSLISKQSSENNNAPIVLQVDHLPDNVDYNKLVAIAREVKEQMNAGNLHPENTGKLELKYE